MQVQNNCTFLCVTHFYLFGVLAHVYEQAYRFRNFQGIVKSKTVTYFEDADEFQIGKVTKDI